MLTTDEIARVAWFDPTLRDHLAAALPGNFETVSAAGNINLAVYESKLTVSGTMAFTLPDGTVAGQRKRVTCESGASTPKATLTVTTPDATTGYACASSFVFDTAGQSVEFTWTGTAWRATDVKRAGGTADNVVVGTTVLTGLNLWAIYACSVTATVNSTGTKALPDGSCVGEVCLVGCSTAASTPVGSLDFTGVTSAAAAATHLQAIGATTDYVSLQWTGTAWLPLVASGITVA